MSDKLNKVGFYNGQFDHLLAKPIPHCEICYSNGLKKHIQKKHPKMLNYIQDIPNIITSPDYIGINPNEKGVSLELIKVYNDNVLLAIKLDSTNNHYYVASIYDITQSKINRRLHSGRIQKV